MLGDWFYAGLSACKRFLAALPEYPLPPTAPMPIKSALGCFCCLLLLLLMLKLLILTYGFASFCPEAMRKEPFVLSLGSVACGCFVKGTAANTGPFPWL